MNEPIEIVRLGHDGDGVGIDGSFIPYTVPGDVVRLGAEPKLRVEEIIKAGPWRIKPACHHFGNCGGCSLQHVAQEAYLGWKRDLIGTALAQRGFENIRIEDVRTVRPAPAGGPRLRRVAVQTVSR